MQEAHIDHSELDRLVEKWAQMPQVMKDAKRQALETAAPKLKAAVDSEIGGTGKVRSWQEGYVGTKGGYAKARPKAETWAEKTKKKGNYYAVGYVTNAINNGHLSPRARRPIAGKRFYQRAQAKAGIIAQETAGQIVQTVVEHLEG